MIASFRCPSNYFPGGGRANATPKILFGGSNGTDITGKTQSVVVGRQIVLYVSYSLPPGLAVQSQDWDVPATQSTPPKAVGGFNTAPTNGGPTVPVLSQRSTTLYFVAPTVANQPNQVNFFLTLSDGNVYSAKPSNSSIQV